MNFPNDFLAITEASDRSFIYSRLAISTFIRHNHWFDGTVVVLTLKNNPLSDQNLKTLRLIYSKIEVLKIDDSELSNIKNRLSKKGWDPETLLDYLYLMAFKIKSSGSLYFSRNIVFQNEISNMLDSDRLTLPIASSKFPDLNVEDNRPVDYSLMWIPSNILSLGIKTAIESGLLNLNIFDFNSRSQAIINVVSNNFIHRVSNQNLVTSSMYINSKYTEFIRYHKGISSIRMNTLTGDMNNYTRIHTYWSHLNKVELDRKFEVRSPVEIDPDFKSKINKTDNYRMLNKDLKFKSGSEFNKLNIALSTICNNDFIDGARVMIYSFLRHNSWFKGKIIVYHNDEFSPLSNKNMNLISELYDNVEFKHVDPTIYKNLIGIFIKGNKQQRRLVPSLFTFEVFNDIKYYDKMLYLDSDMVVLNDISEVFNLEHNLVVTPDAGEYVHRNYETFNGGFLFLNNSISSKQYREKLIKHAEGMKSMQLADQTIMNSFFQEGLPMLSIDYNCLKRCFSDSKYNDNIKNVKIIHYVGEKPWNNKSALHEMKYTKIEEIWKNEINLIHSNIKIAICIHLYYVDLWEEISAELKKINTPFDLHISLCKDNIDISNRITSEYPNSYIVKVKNSGADFGGFFESLNNLFDLNLKYDWILKIHGKKSKLINERVGEIWRKDLYKSLISEFKSKVINHLKDSSAGMIGPKNQIMSMSSFDKRARKNVNENNINLLRKKFNIEDNQLKFFKGSMFWIKYSILENIFKDNRITIDFFEDGHSQDGTRAHAMERFMSNIVRDSGKKIVEI